MYRILLLFLAITLICSIAEANTQQTVDAICKQTLDIKFCNGILAKNPVTSPSMKDLLKVTVTEAERISANTYSFISTILQNVGNGPGLYKCVEAYARVNASFTNAVSLFNNERYAEIIGLMDEVSYGVGISAMEKIIGHMVSS
ncbi:hypothetical protein Bca101_066067 [Brassica carinata]